MLFGKRLGMQITAEGVETEAQENLLSALGCDVLQGGVMPSAWLEDHRFESNRTLAGDPSEVPQRLRARLQTSPTFHPHL